MSKGDGSYWNAEQELAITFCDRLMNDGLFRYVTDIPIVDERRAGYRGGLIKYRMIHMSNHWDGCVTMNDVMAKALETERPPSLFDVDRHGSAISWEDMDCAFRRAAESIEVGRTIKIGELAAAVICEMGVTGRQTEICKNHLSPLLSDGTLERLEKLTQGGREKTSMSPNLVLRRVS